MLWAPTTTRAGIAAFLMLFCAGAALEVTTQDAQAQQEGRRRRRTAAEEAKPI